MPGYVVHLAIAQEYLKKHKVNYSEDFIKGSIYPDFTSDKSKSHYGTSPAYTSLNEFLKSNTIDTDFDKGRFLHLVTDYLFYNHYLDRLEKPQIYNDYDYTNQFLMEKYNVVLPEEVKDKVFFKEGKPEILTHALACKVIDEVSDLKLEEVQKEVIINKEKWNTYKNLVKKKPAAIAYSKGVYDILRATDLQKLDEQIQLSKGDGAESFGLGIYEKELCEHLGLNTPLKTIEDRMKIMKHIRGIDFVFSIPSLDKNIIEKNAKEAYKESLKVKEEKTEKEKKYKIGYAPGTYDLFHAGHLENLLIANEQCEKIIIGIKSDELVKEHKNREPIISAQERVDILRHFKFVHDVYKYYTRDPRIANDWITAKYGKGIDAVFLGSDLKKDFSDIKDLNIIFTDRDEEKMKKRSTTAYRKLYLGRAKSEKYTGNIQKEILSTQLENRDDIKHQEERLEEI